MNMPFLKPLQTLSDVKDTLAWSAPAERLHKLIGGKLGNNQSYNGSQSRNGKADAHETMNGVAGSGIVDNGAASNGRLASGKLLGSKSPSGSLGAERVASPVNLRPKRVKHTVNMEHNVFIVEGRRLRYAVSDNYDDTPLISLALPKNAAKSSNGQASGRGSGQASGRVLGRDSGNEGEEMWVVSLHGFFAGGGMYWEESRYLAEGLGLRVLAPSLPGFGGSDPLPWAKVNVYEIAGQVRLLMDHLGIDNALLMGHSMGGAIAVAFAEMYPERTLGIIYRDGAATPAWRQRSGLIVEVLRPIAPDLANATDLVAALVADLPDMLIGRRRAETIRALFPDFRRNVRSLGRTVPVGAMLFTIDMTGDVQDLVENGDIPLLPVWGCFDRIANFATAEEFEEASGHRVLWVPGGHSWMLARPSAQLDVLTRTSRGRDFLADVMLRRYKAAV